MAPGELVIWFAALLGMVAWVSAICWERRVSGADAIFRYAYHGMTLALGIASAFLLLAILTHDFRYHYVIGYSSRDLPLLYLVSAFWGGQQGTWLLWAFFGALIGYPLFRKNSWEPAAVMACYVPTVMFLLGLMMVPDGNPFRTTDVVPPDGRGLNPLLQDPWMASHPPVVFLGYAAMTVPAVLALVAVIKREEDRWLGTASRWSLIGFLSLGVGIILGGFWAYKVLGWGGYWGWDPVENASLVPWIVVTALLHGLLVQRATGALRRTNLGLAFAGYVTVMYATFLTRSGVLAEFSVHSFPKGSMYVFLGLIIGLVFLVSILALVLRRGPESAVVPMNAGWPLVLTSTIALFGISAVLVLIGTSWPILFSNLGGIIPQSLHRVPNPSFYNSSSLPVYVLLLLLLGIGPFSGWRVSSWKEWGARVWLSLGAAVAGTVAAAALGGHGVKYLVLFLAAGFALASNSFRLVQTARMRVLATGAAVAHLGFAMMMVGIVASSAWQTSGELRLPLGHPVHEMDRIFTYRGLVDGSEPNDRWRVAVMKPGGSETIGEVQMYEVEMGGEPSIMRKPAILRTLTRDLYLAPLGLERGDRDLDLTQGRPVTAGDHRFTFLRFDTTSSGGHGAGMQVNAIVRVEKAGRPPEEVVLPFVADDRGYHGDAVRPESLGGGALLLERMAVDQRRVLVRWTTGEGSEILVVNASIKPLMNLLWAGTILMPLGCGIAVVRRWIDRRALLAAEAAAGGARVSAAVPPERSEAARASVREKDRSGKPATA